MYVIRTLAAAAIALGLAAAAPLHAQDKAKGKERAPVTKVLLENDKVRVAESTFRPGDVSRSDRRPRVNYVLNGAKLERTTKDGKKSVYELKTGQVLWREADSDVVKNVGKTTFKVLSVASK